MEMPKIPPKGKLKAIDVARSEPFRSASLIKSGIPTNCQFPLLGRPSCMAELSQPKALLTEAASSCPWLVDGNRAVRTRRECQQQPECAALPPNPTAQVINPLTFRAQSSKSFGIWTGKAFILAQAINTERRMDLLCRRTGEVTCVSLSLSALVGTQSLVNFPSFSRSSPPRRAPGAGNKWN